MAPSRDHAIVGYRDAWKRSGHHTWVYLTSTRNAASSTSRCRAGSDYIGIDRRANLYGLAGRSTSRRAAEVASQLVHHDIWDYDLGAAPTLVDLCAKARPFRRGADHKMYCCSSSTLLSQRFSHRRTARCHKVPCPRETSPNSRFLSRTAREETPQALVAAKIFSPSARDCEFLWYKYN